MLRMIKRWGIRILLLIIIMLATLSGTDLAISNPKFCGTCHIMRPEVMTWQASAHSKIPCTTCHVSPGMQSTLENELEIVRRIYLVLTQQYLLPVVIKHSVPNQVCLECHTFVRVITPLNDIQVPHQKHVQAGLYCVNCHQGLVHDDLAERNMTIDGNFDEWTPQLGAAQNLPENRRIAMKDCLACHTRLGRGPVIPQCQVCHQKMMLPASHANLALWRTNHGQEALQDVSKCDKCHNYMNIDAEKMTAADLDITQYAKKNTFCSSCHLQRPSSHNITWAHDHTSLSRSVAQGCLVCHDLEEPKEWEKVTPTFCGKCHSANLGPAFFK